MGLVLMPSEIKTNMKMLQGYLESETERYQNVREKVHEYNTNEKLTTESYQKSKELMDVCYQMIANGMNAVRESITGDIDTILGCIGDEYLNEDLLIMQIERLRAQCEQYEAKIRSLESKKFLFGAAGAASSRGMIARYREMIENLKEQIAVLQKKLEFLENVEESTANLFQSAIGLLAALQNVIADGGVNVNTNNVLREKLRQLNFIQNADDEVITEIDSDTKGILVPPQPGDTITVSRGLDSNGKHIYVDAVVSQWNAWSIEYSVSVCNSEFSEDLCCRRLNYAVENYECNKNDDDLLKFNLEGYDEPVFAGAMVNGYADIGDIVQVTLDDDTNFNFLILDVKYTEHTLEELEENDQCQCEWGHGYILGENTVQLSVCEFITAGDCDIDSAIYANSGDFLLKHRVIRTEIVDSIPICDERIEDDSREESE